MSGSATTTPWPETLMPLAAPPSPWARAAARASLTPAPVSWGEPAAGSDPPQATATRDSKARPPRKEISLAFMGSPLSPGVGQDRAAQHEQRQRSAKPDLSRG